MNNIAIKPMSRQEKALLAEAQRMADYRRSVFKLQVKHKILFDLTPERFSEVLSRTLLRMLYAGEVKLPRDPNGRIINI